MIWSDLDRLSGSPWPTTSGPYSYQALPLLAGHDSVVCLFALLNTKLVLERGDHLSVLHVTHLKIKIDSRFTLNPVPVSIPLLT